MQAGKSVLCIWGRRECDKIRYFRYKKAPITSKIFDLYIYQERKVFEMTRKRILVLCIAFSMIFATVPAFAFSADISSRTPFEDNLENDSEGTTEAKVLDKAKQWLQENYGEFYEIRNVEAEIIKQTDSMRTTRYTVSLSCETKYKYESVDEIPFVRGIMNAEKSRALNVTQKDVLQQKIKQIEADASFGDYTELCVDVIIEVDTTDTSKPWKMYYQDGMDTMLRDIDVLKLDEQELYDSGIQTANQMIANAENAVTSQTTRGYASYDRFAARDYARNYSSNATKCDVDGTSCGILQNKAKWNTSEYPYFSLFKHNDCADFVSQAMSEGGIPEKSGWYRTKKGASGTWTNSWTTVAGLKTYMTRSDHVYWDTGTFSSCNAGNILITNSGGHVVMVDFNDGTTHKFTGHTNDRKSYVFGNVSGYQYYIINRSS